MYTAKATLVYGLTVRTFDLAIAGKAWMRLRPVFRFIDLVSLRRRNRALVSRGRRVGDDPAIARIPNEVWDEIRYQLVQDQIKTSQGPYLASARGSHTQEDTWSMRAEARKGFCDDLVSRVREWVDIRFRNWSGVRGFL